MTTYKVTTVKVIRNEYVVRIDDADLSQPDTLFETIRTKLQLHDSEEISSVGLVEDLP